MNPNNGQKLIIVSAPSGAGKTTLCHRLLQEFPELVLSISSTTRAPRGQERHGREYFFLTPQDFEEKIQRGLFAEHALVHGNYYGTSKEMIERAFSQGKSVLLDIDVQGAESLRKAYPGRCFAVFIAPPSMEALRARLEARGTEKPESIERRMRNAAQEMSQASRFDKTVVNDELERAYAELRREVSQALRAQS